MLERLVIGNGQELEEDGLTHELLRKMLTDKIICDSSWVEILRVEHKGFGRASEVLRLIQDESTDDQVKLVRTAQSHLT